MTGIDTMDSILEQLFGQSGASELVDLGQVAEALAASGIDPASLTEADLETLFSGSETDGGAAAETPVSSRPGIRFGALDRWGRPYWPSSGAYYQTHE